MIAAFMLENYPRALVEVLLFIAQVPDRGERYEGSRIGAGIARNFWWISSFMMNAVGIKVV